MYVSCQDLTGIQSEPHVFDESRFIMTFLTILGVIGRNVMELQISSTKETGKDIPESSRLEFLEKFLAKHFALLDAEDNTSRLLNRGGIADLPLIFTDMTESTNFL